MTTRYPDTSNGIDLNEWLKREAQHLDHYCEIAKRRAEDNIRRARLMRRLAVVCAAAVGCSQAAGGVWLLALLYIAWLNPHRTDAIMLFAAMASAAILGACLFSMAYWFFDLRS